MSRGSCQGCREQADALEFTMAFQPIVDLTTSTIWGYEALVRGVNGESAWSILSQITEKNRYHFDQACRVKAIEAAGRLFKSSTQKLSINFLPNAVYEPAACIKTSLAAADKVGLSRSQLMFEFTENEKIGDSDHVRRIIEAYKLFGFTTALDDFGAGYAGLTLLAKFAPDIIKIDMELIRNINTNRPQQVIVAGILDIARTLNIQVLAEGIETLSEAEFIRDMGVSLMQGYLFAYPELNRLPPVNLHLNDDQAGIRIA